MISYTRATRLLSFINLMEGLRTHLVLNKIEIELMGSVKLCTKTLDLGRNVKGYRWRRLEREEIGTFKNFWFWFGSLVRKSEAEKAFIRYDWDHESYDS